MIRGVDGVEHERIPPCAYPRFSPNGRALPAGAPATDRQLQRRGVESSPAPSKSTYDGWVSWYDSNIVTIAPGSTLVTEWIVPDRPKNVGSQDIAFFNDIDTKDIILQPVLDFSEIPGEWAIESENCCGPTGNGTDVQSTLVQVSPGDVIRGEVAMAGCTGDLCNNWTITTTDLTTGKSTSLTMQNPGEAADEVNPAVLETYGITSCDMLPANGEIQFFNNALTNGTGGAEPEPYTLETILSPVPSSPPPSTFPETCGYGGSASGNNFTLVFSTSPTSVGDAGAGVVDSGAGSSSGGSSSGGVDSGVGGSSSSSSGGSSSGGNGSSSGASGSSSGSSSGTSGGGAGNDAGVSGSGANSSPRAAPRAPLEEVPETTPGPAARGANGATGGDAGGSAGCACGIAGANGNAGASLVVGLLLLTAARRRKSRSQTSREVVR